MTIIQMRQELNDIRAEITRATEEGLALARNPQASMEQVQAASDNIDRLQVAARLLESQITSAERDGAANAATTSAATGAQNGGSGNGSRFANFAEFLRAVHDSDARGSARDERLMRVRDAATGANEGTPADGGYLVPPEYADGIIDLVRGQSVLLPKVRRVTIEGNRLIETYLAETDRKDAPTGTRHGGHLAFWKGEAEQYKNTKAKFAERTTQLAKLTAMVYVTEELLQDAPAIESFNNAKVGEALSWKVDDAILNGTGTGMPLGILGEDNAALVTVAKEAGQKAKTITAENIFKMWDAMIAQQRAGAAWYIHQDAEILLMQAMQQLGSVASTGTSAVEKIVGNVGMPLYMPAGVYGSTNSTILGKPVIPLEQCAALGSKGDIIFADMSQYLLIERAGMTRQSSVHVRFDYDEVGFKYTWRLGGRPEWMSAITGNNSTTARSPYVTLAARG